MDVEKLLSGLDGILTKDFSKNKRTHFQVETDLSHLSDIGMGLEKDPSLFIPMVFSRLSTYFHAGLLFLNERSSPESERWSVVASFVDGVYFPIDPDVIVNTIDLPKTKVGQLKKGGAHHILGKLKLKELEKPEQSFFFIRINEVLAFGLFSTMAEPWLKIHVEKIHQQLMLLLSQEL